MSGPKHRGHEARWIRRRLAEEQDWLSLGDVQSITPADRRVRHVHVVPHIHWDREWHQPFQRFRIQLVDALDVLLADLRHDPGFCHFLLDGQMAAIDDYLAVRPEQEAVLRALAAEGRIAMGPWYTQPDEFLVSGETLIRDLHAGIARAAEIGAPMPVGYLPDMFGHAAQMPQILRLFGFEHARMGADTWEAASAAMSTAQSARGPIASTCPAGRDPLPSKGMVVSRACDRRRADQPNHGWQAPLAPGI
jgi:hypothetical protein